MSRIIMYYLVRKYTTSRIEVYNKIPTHLYMWDGKEGHWLVFTTKAAASKAWEEERQKEIDGHKLAIKKIKATPCEFHEQQPHNEHK